MADITPYLVELAFALSFAGFITIMILIPKKSEIDEGKAGYKMASPLVPTIIASGILVAGFELIISLFARSDDVMYLGIITSILLVLAYGAIFLEFRSVKRHMAMAHPHPEHVHTVPHLEHAHAVHPHHEHIHEVHPTNEHPQMEAAPDPNMMTVECPRCRKHLTIMKGAQEITCPHCGLTGSL